MRINRIFRDMWDKARSEPIAIPRDISRVVDVHPSQIPICPLLYMLYLDTQYSYMDMAGNIIVDEGTAMHAVCQRFLSRDPRAFGIWCCTSCGSITNTPQTRPLKCECGSHDFIYQEVPINYHGFVGHIDFMIEEKGRHYLIDFKSSGKNMSEKVRNTPLNYDLQTLSYALLLKLQYKVTISERALVYIDRNNPNIMKMGCVTPITNKDLHTIHGILKDQKNLLNFLLDCTTYKEFMDNVGIQRCSNPYCPVCSKLSDSEINRKLKERFHAMNGISIRASLSRK